jgi:hypothetical protein
MTPMNCFACEESSARGHRSAGLCLEIFPAVICPWKFTHFAVARGRGEKSALEVETWQMEG